MFDCCNPECDGVSKMIRCGKCRHERRYYCASCDHPVLRCNKIYCNDCAVFSHRRWEVEYRQQYWVKRKKSLYNKQYNEQKQINNTKHKILQ